MGSFPETTIDPNFFYLEACFLYSRNRVVKCCYCFKALSYVPAKKEEKSKVKESKGARNAVNSY